MSEDEAFAGYAPGVTDRYHEAGYDAYETGMCFVNIVDKFIVGEGNPKSKSPDTPARFLPSGNGPQHLAMAHFFFPQNSFFPPHQNAARLLPRFGPC